MGTVLRHAGGGEVSAAAGTDTVGDDEDLGQLVDQDDRSQTQKGLMHV